MDIEMSCDNLPPKNDRDLRDVVNEIELFVLGLDDGQQAEDNDSWHQLDEELVSEGKEKAEEVDWLVVDEQKIASSSVHGKQKSIMGQCAKRLVSPEALRSAQNYLRGLQPRDFEAPSEKGSQRVACKYCSKLIVGKKRSGSLDSYNLAKHFMRCKVRNNEISSANEDFLL
mmetsp:Transcript_23942/g.46939  ORF Transcript_23942/g.46939 Transcript_23942/m.46939 type:complete len:171 (-) Transcript_23942:105-617(-)